MMTNSLVVYSFLLFDHETVRHTMMIISRLVKRWSKLNNDMEVNAGRETESLSRPSTSPSSCHRRSHDSRQETDFSYTVITNKKLCLVL